MKETGIISKHQRHWLAPKPPCLSDALFSSVNFTSTMGSITLLISGYLLALLILILELVHFYWGKDIKCIMETKLKFKLKFHMKNNQRIVKFQKVNFHGTFMISKLLIEYNFRRYLMITRRVAETKKKQNFKKYYCFHNQNKNIKKSCTRKIIAYKFKRKRISLFYKSMIAILK